MKTDNVVRTPEELNNWLTKVGYRCTDLMILGAGLIILALPLLALTNHVIIFAVFVLGLICNITGILCSLFIMLVRFIFNKMNPPVENNLTSV